MRELSKVVRIETFTFYAATRESGSDMTTIRIDRNERPYGMIWTFTVRGEYHGWHAKLLTGEYKHGTFEEVEAWVRETV